MASRKIHKPEVPLRPIASFINSPCYELSKHLVHLLSPLVRNTSSFVKNSTEFAAFISDQIWCRPGFIWCHFSLHKCTSRIGLPGSRCTTSCWWFTLWTNHLITGWNTETPEVLFECYLYSLSRRMVPADAWHCHGFPSVSDGGKPCQGGCWRESPCIIPHPTTLLETFHGWHLYSQPPEQFPQPPQVHWVINWLHSWDGGSAEIALPWLAD